MKSVNSRKTTDGAKVLKWYKVICDKFCQCQKTSRTLTGMFSDTQHSYKCVTLSRREGWKGSVLKIHRPMKTLSLVTKEMSETGAPFTCFFTLFVASVGDCKSGTCAPVACGMALTLGDRLWCEPRRWHCSRECTGEVGTWLCTGVNCIPHAVPKHMTSKSQNYCP